MRKGNILPLSLAFLCVSSVCTWRSYSVLHKAYAVWSAAVWLAVCVAGRLYYIAVPGTVPSAAQPTAYSLLPATGVRAFVHLLEFHHTPFPICMFRFRNYYCFVIVKAWQNWQYIYLLFLRLLQIGEWCFSPSQTRGLCESVSFSACIVCCRTAFSLVLYSRPAAKRARPIVCQ